MCQLYQLMDKLTRNEKNEASSLVWSSWTISFHLQFTFDEITREDWSQITDLYGGFRKNGDYLQLPVYLLQETLVPLCGQESHTNFLLSFASGNV